MRTSRRILSVLGVATAVVAASAPGPARASVAPRDVSVASLSVGVLNRDETVPAVVTGSGFTAGTTASLGPGVTVEVTSVTSDAIDVVLSATVGAPTGLRALRVDVPHHPAAHLPKALRVAFAPVLAAWAVGDGATDFTTTLVRPTFASTPRLAVAGAGVAARGALGPGGVLDVDVSVAQGAATGWRALTITDGAATWHLKDGIKVRPAPVVTSVTPLAQGEPDVTVKVRGRDFEVCQHAPTLVVAGPGVTVNWASSALGNLLYANLSVAAGTPLGPRSVTLTNCDSQGRSVPADAFSVLGAPVVTSVPAIAVGATRTVLVRGSNLTPATSLSASDGVTFADVTYVSPTRLRATLSCAPGSATGTRDVTALDAGGLQETTTGALRVDADPTATSLAPAGIGANRTGLVTVHGTGFEPGATVEVELGGRPDPEVEVSPSRVVASTELEVLVVAKAKLALGQDQLVVANPDGGLAAPLDLVTDPEPELTSVVPSTTAQGTVVVAFTAPRGAPPGEAYTALACTNAGLTEACRSRPLGATGGKVAGLVPGTRYFVAVEAAADGSFAGSRSNVEAVLSTVQLGGPRSVQAVPSVRVPGAIVVRFVGALHAPRSQRYAVLACRDAALRSGCARAQIASGGALRGLAQGATYHLVVEALASPGYLASRSTEASALATRQLAAPVVRSAVLSSGALTVRFAPPAVRPAHQRYELRACANAAMTSGCATFEPTTSGATVRFGSSTCYVRVTALASTGYLAAASKPRAAT